MTSDEHTSAYEDYMTKYLEQLKILFKDIRIKPIHHAPLHLGEFLRRFGPVHAWRSFVFERYNHLLQRQNTNLKFGALFAILQSPFVYHLILARGIGGYVHV